MITLNSLSALTAKDLGEQAKKLGVAGWRSMKKQELIQALLKVNKQRDREKSKALKNNMAPTGKTTSRQTTASGSKLHSVNRLTAAAKPPKNLASLKPASAKPASSKSAPPKTKTSTTSVSATSTPRSLIAEKLRANRERTENLKNLALISSLDREQKLPEADRLVLIVRDSYWIQAYWEITRSTVERARVALESQWHLARPVLRLLEVYSDGSTNIIEKVVEQIPIHGGVKNWFIHLKQPATPYRVAIGYVVDGEKFHLICKSNQICSPPSSANAVDENWTDLTNDVEKYFALSGGYDEKTQSDDLQDVFEEKSRHPIHAPAFERLGSGINGHSSEFTFHVDAYLVVHGKTISNGSVMIAGEPVRLQRDGTFSVKVDLPDRRQVLPVIASSRDGTQQRTTVLAVERNTKVMEPLVSDMDSE